MTRAPFPESPLAGSALKNGLNTRFKQLYDAAAFPLTSIGGTANAVTATLVPALDMDGLLDGMSFSITWAETNTGGVTLAINGGSPRPVLNADGSALASGSIGAGVRSLLTYFGGSFMMMSPNLLMGASQTVRYSWQLTSSGTWTKPTGLPNDTPVFIEGWGAGGGGGSNTNTGGGGGGGGYLMRIVRAGDLGATVTATIGAGGGVGSAGGNTSFGGFLTAYGGGGGGNTNGSGGGGGGTNEAGGNGVSGGGPGGFFGGGRGGFLSGEPTVVNARQSATGLYGGGGGGAGWTSGDTGGGWAVYGGGGGAGGSTGPSGGTSVYGGAGGNRGSAGQAPGGGGGRNAAGARGELRVWI